MILINEVHFFPVNTFLPHMLRIMSVFLNLRIDIWSSDCMTVHTVSLSTIINVHADNGNDDDR